MCLVMLPIFRRGFIIFVRWKATGLSARIPPVARQPVKTVRSDRRTPVGKPANWKKFLFEAQKAIEAAVDTKAFGHPIA